MKQSVVNYMKKQVDGFAYTGPKELPGNVIPQDYEPIWYEFLGSRVYKDLIRGAQNTTHKNYLTVVGFASYISTFDDFGYDFVTDTINLAKPDISNTVKKIKDVIRRFRLLQHLKPVKLTHDIQYTSSDMLNMALVLHLEGFVWLQPKQNNHNLDSILHSLKGSLYSKEMPKKLCKDKCFSSDKLLNNPTLFEHIYKGSDIALSLGRVRGSTLLLRYDIDLETSLFYGNQYKLFDKALGEFWSKELTLG